MGADTSAPTVVQESHADAGNEKVLVNLTVQSDDSTSQSSNDIKPPPLGAKLFAVFLISCISFGSHWSSGVTGAMKSTIKKQMHITNVQFSLLEASEDFMATLLLIPSGLITDRLGGAGKLPFSSLVHRLIGSHSSVANSRVFRNDRVWKHCLHNWVNSCGRGDNRPLLQVHDWRASGSCSWRHCHADRPV